MGFHPNMSHVSSSEIDRFINSPLKWKLENIPSVTESIVKVFNENDIHTTYQLIAKYLSFSYKDTCSVERMNMFYSWLLSLGILGEYRAMICISIGELCNIYFPGTYDSSKY